MKDIKFRAWENELGRNRMFSWDEIKKDFESWLNVSDTFVMQFTGITDKNEKEIYEGDVLKHHAHGVISVMLWIDKYSCFAGQDHNKEYYFYQKLDIKNLEVIGNIYENPEILKIK